MKKVITYGTYDVFHFGHQRLLERAKALGDYLIVGVTSDDFDKSRGKINVQQSLMQRVENVRKTGLADEIIIEEYEGQKIDDILHYGVQIFTVGSDWKGKFDYLSDYCEVVYLDRTQGISSTQVRSLESAVKLGLVGDAAFIEKYYRESNYANGIEVTNVYTQNAELLQTLSENVVRNDSYEALLAEVDAVYIATRPRERYHTVMRALEQKKHVLCESPLALTVRDAEALFTTAKQQGVVLMDSIKTAHATAYNRLLLLLKSGKIGDIISVDTTCTSLREWETNGDTLSGDSWSSLGEWGPTALLPIFQILGAKPKESRMVSLMKKDCPRLDLFTKIDFLYANAVASVQVGKGVKSEGELIISGTKGYVVVPAPWWKTDYFEVKYENQEKNNRYFYQLNGEGIRGELVAFVRSIREDYPASRIDKDISIAIAKVMQDFYEGKSVTICSEVE